MKKLKNKNMEWLIVCIDVHKKMPLLNYNDYVRYSKLIIIIILNEYIITIIFYLP